MRETTDGQLSVELVIKPSPNTSKELIERLRATMCGLQYVLSKNEEEITRLGEAYIDGLEIGLKISTDERPRKDPNKPQMGFHADL